MATATVDANGATLQFTMRTNLTLVANFVDVQEADGEHCHTDGEPAVDQQRIYRDRQGRRQCVRGRGVLLAEWIGLGAGGHRQPLDELDSERAADARFRATIRAYSKSGHPRKPLADLPA